jgi:hypothetical protein
MGRHTRVGIQPQTEEFTLVGTGSTANRPTLAADQKGFQYFNTDVNQLEIWNGSYWFVVGTLPNLTVASSQTIGSNHAYWVNTTSGAVNLTLPASPRQGDVIKIYDTFGTFQTNNCSVVPNGAPIMRTNDTMTISTQGAALSMTYYDATRGWLLDAI